MLPEQKVKTKWYGKTRNHFEKLGYLYTGNLSELEVNAKDLTTFSKIKVNFICDYCLGDNQTEEDKWKCYSDLIIGRNKTGKDCCKNRECIKKKQSEAHSLRGVNSEETLAEKFPLIAKEWDYQKNKKSIDEYSYGSTHEVWWNCNKGHEWKMSIKKRTRSKHPCSCPYCSGRKVCEDNCLAKIKPEIAEEWHPFKNENNTPYDFTSGSGKIVHWLCKKCDRDWSTPISQRTTKNGTNCPYCSESKGEKRVRKWLNDNSLIYESQKEFYGLLGTGGGLLSYDFYLPNQNILIEYQGEFHDGTGSNSSYTKANLEAQQEHDRRKRKYAETKGIKLLEIWHWDFDNVENILEEEINLTNFLQKTCRHR